MTVGNGIALLISAAALYCAYAFVRTQLFKQPTWPFTKIKLD